MFPLKMEIREVHGIVIAKISGKIDQQTYVETRDKVRNLILSGKNKIVIDLTNIQLVSSAGWDTIVNNRKFAEENHGDIKLCCLSEEVLEVFNIMDLKDFIKTYSTVDQAVESFSTKTP